MRASAVTPVTRTRTSGRPREVAGSAGALRLAAPAAGEGLGFGPHLVFDGSDCPVELLDDLDRLYALLERLPDEIHMTRIMPPYVFRHGAPGSPGAGLSGFVLIAESHISVHTFPARRHVNVDVFSCEHFDTDLVRAALRRAFAPRRVAWKLLDRGREFPKNIGSSRAVVMHDRAAVSRGLGLEASR